MKPTYLCLYPSTFFWKGRNKMLLYESINHRFLEMEQNREFGEMQSRLMQLENAYSIPIEEPLLSQYKYVWDEIRNGAFGELVQAVAEEKPLSYPPVPKINQNMDTIRYSYGNRQAGYILQYLQEVTIYLSGNENIRDSYYKQTIYPLCDNHTLSRKKLVRWFEATKGGALKVVNFLGDPRILSGYRELFSSLTDAGIALNYYILPEEFLQFRVTGSIPAELNIVLIYSGNMLQRIDPDHDAVCLVKDEKELSEAEQALSGSENTPKSVELVPVYTGGNHNFFQQHIFISKAELFLSGLSKQDIFTRMTLNINFFGKLTILPDGNIYSNLNVTPLGSLEDSLYEIIFKELDQEKSWLHVRREAPCDQCRFRWLCPPVSDYEYVMGQYNLCTVKECER